MLRLHNSIPRSTDQPQQRSQAPIHFFITKLQSTAPRSLSASPSSVLTVPHRLGALVVIVPNDVQNYKKFRTIIRTTPLHALVAFKLVRLCSTLSRPEFLSHSRVSEHTCFRPPQHKICRKIRSLHYKSRTTSLIPTQGRLTVVVVSTHPTSQRAVQVVSPSTNAVNLEHTSVLRTFYAKLGTRRRAYSHQKRRGMARMWTRISSRLAWRG